MDHAIAAREAINADPDVKISFNDMVIKACAMALRKHPQVNSQWTPEATRIAKHIHIGVAVAVEEGLLVPVLKFGSWAEAGLLGCAARFWLSIRRLGLNSSYLRGAGVLSSDNSDNTPHKF